jgi:hypothetical protein
MRSMFSTTKSTTPNITDDLRSRLTTDFLSQVCGQKRARAPSRQGGGSAEGGDVGDVNDGRRDASADRRVVRAESLGEPGREDIGR